ncbi:hypothetical protein [Microbaculum sp. FT89]|uniref:hypothetical protein n=1 Tax=Microbaculum sp. FT89 TaxID=3447298 RepID=UPI003F5359E4
MWTDRLFASLALISLVAFLGVLVVYVKRIDLAVVVGIVIILAAYDFYRELTA